MSETETTTALVQRKSLSPSNLTEAMSFAKMLADSDMVPKDFQRKPANCLIAIQWGYELGLGPLQAIQNIAVINGRPTIWGDAALALVRAHPACESIVETVQGDGDERAGICTVKRRGEPVQSRRFSIANAKKAGLWGKQGPWTQYPDRMLQLRARGFALRDIFPDALRGVVTAEEALDTDPPPTVEVKSITTDLPKPTNGGDEHRQAWDAKFSKWLEAVPRAKSVADLDTLAAKFKASQQWPQEYADRFAIRCQDLGLELDVPTDATPEASQEPAAGEPDKATLDAEMERDDAILRVREELKRTTMTEQWAVSKTTAKKLDDVTLSEANMLLADLSKRTGAKA